MAIAHYLIASLIVYFGVTAPRSYNLLILLIVGLVVIEQLVSYLYRLGLLKPKYTLVELKLPLNDSSDLVNNQQLYAMLYSLLDQERAFWSVIKKNRISFELKSSHDSGLHLYAYLPLKLELPFKEIMISAMPGCRVVRTDKHYLSENIEVVNFQTRPANNQINEQENLEAISLLTNSSNYLSKNHVVVYQLVIEPSSNNHSVTKLVLSIVKTILHVFVSSLSLNQQTSNSGPTPNSGMTFKACLRLGFTVNKTEPIELRSTLIGALSSTSLNQKRLIVARRTKFKRLSGYLFMSRLLNLVTFKDLSLSPHELSALLPLSSVSSLSKKNILEPLDQTLAMSLALSKRSNNEVFLGLSIVGQSSNKIGLTKDERLRHTLITGATGSGKTSLLQYSIMQDITAGRGVCVIDPHGDLAEDIIKLVPPAKIKEVIYYDPSDISYPIGINILEIDPSLSGDALILQKDLITESLVSIFKKLFDNENTSAHRLEHILRNAIQTSFYVDNPTLFTIYRLLNESKYRKSVVNQINNQGLRSFWQNEYDKAGDMQRVKLSFGLTSKLGRFLRSSVTRRTLGQTKSTISFNHIINNQKILICNLAKGKIGEDNSSLIGSIILAKLQLAAYERQMLKPNGRQPFYLYVDEFQNFANPSFVQMLSESRKYGIGLIMAEQSISQQKEQLINNVILANVGCLICFRTSSPGDERLLLPLFAPDVKLGQLMNLPSHHFIMRLNAVKSFSPFTGESILTKRSKPDNHLKVIESSRKNYGYKY